MPPIPTSIDTIYALCVEILAAAETALTDSNLALPENRFVAFNSPAWDCCDHLTTHMNVVNPITSRNDSCARAFEAEIVLTLIACAPIIEPPNLAPTNEEMDRNAHGFYQRAWVLYQGLACAHAAGTLVPSLSGCEIVRMGKLVPHGPQGGCGSITISFYVQIS